MDQTRRRFRRRLDDDPQLLSNTILTDCECCPEPPIDTTCCTNVPSRLYLTITLPRAMSTCSLYLTFGVVACLNAGEGSDLNSFVFPLDATPVDPLDAEGCTGDSMWRWTDPIGCLNDLGAPFYLKITLCCTLNLLTSAYEWRLYHNLDVFHNNCEFYSCQGLAYVSTYAFLTQYPWTTHSCNPVFLQGTALYSCDGSQDQTATYTITE